MDFKRIVLSCLLLIVGLLGAGCFGSTTAKLSNELSFSLEGISELTISYDEETVTCFESSDDQLVIKEFMSENKSEYHAKVFQRDGSLHISEGNRPLGGGFYRYVEVYLPAGYEESLITTTTSGNIDLTRLYVDLASFHADTTSGRIEIELAAADSIRLTTTSGEIDCGTLSGDIYLETKSGVISVQSVDSSASLFAAHTTSGTFRLGTVQANTVEIKTTSGDVSCESVSGRMEYVTTSGSLEIRSAAGSGSFEVSNQGRLVLVFSEVTDDLFFYNKNNDIDLTLPVDLSFYFLATTRNGSVTTTFGQELSSDGNVVSGAVGDSPGVTIRLETQEGDIHVRQQLLPLSV